LKSSSSELKVEKVAVAKEKMTQVGNRALEEGRDLFSVTARAIDLSFKQDINPEDIVLVCDEIDKVSAKQSSDKSFPDVSISEALKLEEAALRFGRRNMLITMMKEDYDTYRQDGNFIYLITFQDANCQIFRIFLFPTCQCYHPKLQKMMAVRLW